MSPASLRKVLKTPYKRDGAKIILTECMWLELRDEDNIVNLELLDFVALERSQKRLILI